MPLVALFYLFSGPCASQTLEVLYDPRPKRDGSLQSVSYALPAHWTERSARDIAVLVFVKQGRVTGGGLSEFGPPILLGYERSRISYVSGPALAGVISFRILLYYLPLGEYRLSDVREIRFDRPVLGPIAHPGAYAGTQPQMPQPNLDVGGDVFVDAASGDDRNNGSIGAPVRTIGQGMRLVEERFPTPRARAGKHLILRGGIYEGSDNPFEPILDLIGFEGGVPGNPFHIRGYPGEQVRLRGHRGQRGFYYFAVDMRGAKHVTLENLIVDNASYMEGINLDETTGVALRFVDIYAFGSKWGAQAFGELTDFLAEGCRFSGASGEHNVYVAAGTVTPGLLGRRIVFRGNEFDHASWWGLQINGTVQDVLIENNLFWENGLGPITVKGGSGVTIRNNTMVGNNRQVSIENYFDETYWHKGYGPDPSGHGRGDVTDWWRTHFSTMGYIDIVYNTIVVPQESCMPPHKGGPEERPAISLVEFAGTDVDGYPIAEPFKHVRVDNNIIVSRNPAILDAQVTAPLEYDRADRMVRAFEIHDNLFFATGGPVAFGRKTSFVLEPAGAITGREPRGASVVSTVGHIVRGRSPRPVGEPLAQLELVYPGWNNNVFDLDPLFVYLPPCPGYQAGRFYDWENVAFSGDLRVAVSSPAVDRGRPATYSNGFQHLLSTDGQGRARLLPDLGALESF